MADRCRVKSVANARNDAANDHLSRAVGCYLQYSANAHDRCAKDNSFLPAKHLSDRESAHSAEEAANVIWTT